MDGIVEKGPGTKTSTPSNPFDISSFVNSPFSIASCKSLTATKGSIPVEGRAVIVTITLKHMAPSSFEMVSQLISSTFAVTSCSETSCWICEAGSFVTVTKSSLGLWVIFKFLADI